MTQSSFSRDRDRARTWPAAEAQLERGDRHRPGLARVGRDNAPNGATRLRRLVAPSMPAPVEKALADTASAVVKLMAAAQAELIKSEQQSCRPPERPKSPLIDTLHQEQLPGKDP
jgi:hypothetical protein